MTDISIYEEALTEKVVFVDSIVEKVTEKLSENNNNLVPRQMHTKHVQEKLLQRMQREKCSSKDSRIVEIVTETDVDIIMLNISYQYSNY